MILHGASAWVMMTTRAKVYQQSTIYWRWEVGSKKQIRNEKLRL